MSATNPYNCAKPGNLFAGYRAECKSILAGLAVGSSFGVVGGRRCGKTSLLLKIQQELLRSPELLPSFLDMHAVVPKSPHDFFRALEGAFTRGLPVQPWCPSGSEPAYQAFLARVKVVDRHLERAYGPRWTVVLLLDELDAAADSLDSDECFQNLRNLLSVSDYRSRFRLVSAVAAGHAELIKQGSPLNILEKISTRVLSADELEELVGAGFPELPRPPAVTETVQQAGGHPYVLQALLFHLWELRGEPGALQPVRQASWSFIRDRASVLRRWARDIGASGRAVYEELLAAEAYSLPLDELARRLRRRGQLSTLDGLASLSLHALIEDSVTEPPRICCEVFREWYVTEHPGDEAAPPAPSGTEAGVEPREVLIVSGRDRKAHAATCAFLRSLGLEPLEWSEMVDRTGDAAPFAGEVLEAAFTQAAAVVVLFTPDDEVRLATRHVAPFDPDYERELWPQPRPNVLFEAGMAMARFPKRTVFVQVGKIRPISDLSGRHFVRMDGSFDARQELARRLKAAGCAVNLDTTAWHKAGDFTA